MSKEKEKEKSILERLKELSDKKGIPLDILKRNIYSVHGSTCSNQLTPEQKLEILEELL